MDSTPPTKTTEVGKTVGKTVAKTAAGVAAVAGANAVVGIGATIAAAGAIAGNKKFGWISPIDKYKFMKQFLNSSSEINIEKELQKIQGKTKKIIDYDTDLDYLMVFLKLIDKTYKKKKHTLILKNLSIIYIILALLSEKYFEFPDICYKDSVFNKLYFEDIYLNWTNTNNKASHNLIQEYVKKYIRIRTLGSKEGVVFNPIFDFDGIFDKSSRQEATDYYKTKEQAESFALTIDSFTDSQAASATYNYEGIRAIIVRKQDTAQKNKDNFQVNLHNGKLNQVQLSLFTENNLELKKYSKQLEGFSKIKEGKEKKHDEYINKLKKQYDLDRTKSNKNLKITTDDKISFKKHVYSEIGTIDDNVLATISNMTNTNKLFIPRIKNTNDDIQKDNYLDSYLDFIFYYSSLQLLKDDFIKILKSCREILGVEKEKPLWGKKKDLWNHLEKYKCLKFFDILISTTITKGLDPLENLSHLLDADRKEDFSYIIEGKLKGDIINLKACIQALLNKSKKDEEEAAAAARNRDMYAERNKKGKQDKLDKIKQLKDITSSELKKDVVDIKKIEGVLSDKQQESDRESMDDTVKKDQVDISQTPPILTSDPNDVLVTDSSYTPLDDDDTSLLSVTRLEINKLRNVENSITEQLIQDKLKYEQDKNKLKQILIDEKNKLNDETTKLNMIDSIKQSNLNFKDSVIQKEIDEKMRFLEKKTAMYEKQRLKDIKEFELFKKQYFLKLNKELKNQFKHLKYNYEGKPKKQKRIMYEEIKHNKKSKNTMNPFLRHLETNLQGLYENPLMVNTKKQNKTHKKNYKMGNGVNFIKQEIQNQSR